MEYANNIYIINLKRHTDRWEKIVNLLKDYPINYQRFDAICGKDLDQKFIKENSSWFARNLLINYATLGCYLSHISLWQNLVNDKDNDFYLIFEDDFTIVDFPKLQKLYNLFKKGEIDEKVDYLSVYGNAFKSDKNKESHLLSTDYIYDDIIIGKKKFPLTCLGYFITKSGAMKLLERMNKVRYHIDFYIAMLNLFHKDINIYNTQTNLIVFSDEAFQTSAINEHQTKSLLYYLLDYNRYYPFQYPAVVIKLKKSFSIECILSIIISLISIYLFYRIHNPFLKILFFCIFIFSLVNVCYTC